MEEDPSPGWTGVIDVMWPEGIITEFHKHSMCDMVVSLCFRPLPGIWMIVIKVNVVVSWRRYNKRTYIQYVNLTVFSEGFFTFFPSERFFFSLLGVFPDPMWGQRSGMSCVRSKVRDLIRVHIEKSWGEFIFCDIGFKKLNWIESFLVWRPNGSQYCIFKQVKHKIKVQTIRNQLFLCQNHHSCVVVT